MPPNGFPLASRARGNNCFYGLPINRFLRKAKPEPDFKYFSNKKASKSL